MDGRVGGAVVILADTDLDPANMPPCCVASFTDFYKQAPEVVVQRGHEFVCPTCGSYTILADDDEWHFAGGDDDAA
jgi:ribosomal protein S27AE